ncbi:MAG: hypothetical protein AAB403_08215 [Planctomycetota bacterium]
MKQLTRVAASTGVDPRRCEARWAASALKMLADEADPFNLAAGAPTTPYVSGGSASPEARLEAEVVSLAIVDALKKYGPTAFR